MDECRRLRESSLDADDKDAICKFVEFKTAQGVGFGRQSTIMSILRIVSTKHCKGVRLVDIDADALRTIFVDIQRTEYKEWTRFFYESTLKSFLVWRDPDVFTGITIKHPRGIPIDATLTKTDIDRMLLYASVRDTAIIAVLYESGVRVGELLALRHEDVVFDDFGAKLKVHGKTGWRIVRVVWSASYLAMYLDGMSVTHPTDTIWRTLDGRKLLSYFALTKQLKVIAQRAGIKKRVNPHYFRHSAATNLSTKLTESQLAEYLGWVQGSNMPSVYVHLSSRDLDRDILKLYRIETEPKEPSELMVIRCSRCGVVNPIHYRLCRNCSLPLTVAGAVGEDRALKEKFIKFMNLARNNPELKELLE